MTVFKSKEPPVSIEIIWVLGLASNDHTVLEFDLIRQARRRKTKTYLCQKTWILGGPNIAKASPLDRKLRHDNYVRGIQGKCGVLVGK